MHVILNMYIKDFKKLHRYDLIYLLWIAEFVFLMLRKDIFYKLQYKFISLFVLVFLKYSSIKFRNILINDHERLIKNC